MLGDRVAVSIKPYVGIKLSISRGGVRFLFPNIGEGSESMLLGMKLQDFRSVLRLCGLALCLDRRAGRTSEFIVVASIDQPEDEAEELVRPDMNASHH